MGFKDNDLISVSGFEVTATEVEDVLSQHSSIIEAAVIGTPDDYQGQVVQALVRLKPGASASEEELLKYCRKILPPYKAPRSITFVEDFPRAADGTILKQEIQLSWDNVIDNDFFVPYP